MSDILIYTTPEKLLHKQDKLENDPDKSPDGTYYWELHNRPKRVEIGDRIFFATEGFIRGYFVLENVEIRGITPTHKIRHPLAGDCCLTFKSDSWKYIKPIPQKPFQGFKYVKIFTVGEK